MGVMTETTAARPSVFLRGTRALARATGPIGRALAGQSLIPLWGVVQYRGRRTGRDLSTPVQIRATPDSFVIALPWGSGTQWVRNVQAAGGCTILWKGKNHRAESPEVLSLEEARAFSGWQRALLRIGHIDEFLRLRRVGESAAG